MNEEREKPEGMPGNPITSKDLTDKQGFISDPEEDTSDVVIVDYDTDGEPKPLETYDGDDEETRDFPVAKPEKPTVKPSLDEIHENHQDNPYALK